VGGCSKWRIQPGANEKNGCNVSDACMFQAIKLAIYIFLYIFWSLWNVTHSYSTVPTGNSDSHYEISLYELFPETQLFVRAGSARKIVPVLN
jgi:hypothetical protein